MKNKPSSNKNTIIIAVIIIVALFGIWYFYLKGGSSSSTSQLISSSSGGNDNSAVGADVLSILNSVSSISIDASFFQTPAYQSLVDYSIAVPPQPVGRPNPFAPVGQ